MSQKCLSELFDEQNVYSVYVVLKAGGQAPVGH